MLGGQERERLSNRAALHSEHLAELRFCQLRARCDPMRQDRLSDTLGNCHRARDIDRHSYWHGCYPKSDKIIVNKLNLKKSTCSSKRRSGGPIHVGHALWIRLWTVPGKLFASRIVSNWREDKTRWRRRPMASSGGKESALEKSTINLFSTDVADIRRYPVPAGPGSCRCWKLPGAVGRLPSARRR